MDIIIALKLDRTFQELRYALRSIETHLTGYRDIYLFGAKPSWVQNVIHIRHGDQTQRKQLNIYKKFLAAANTESVSENFIRWDDDVYLLNPMDVSEIKDWHGGTLKHWSELNINTLYRNVIKNTLQIFPDGLYYDIHAPRVFNKEKYKELEKYPWLRKEILTKSTYFNHVQSAPVEMKDPKRHKDLFYSTNNLSHEDEKMLRNLFPNPSRYEADNKANAKATSGMAEATG